MSETGSGTGQAFSTRDVVVRYPGASVNALDGVTMAVPEGLLYAVLGPNGSGKSTLMRCLLGVTPLRSGSVSIAGRALPTWTRKALALHIGVVAQTEVLAFPIRVRDFVAMGRYPHLGPLQPEREQDREAITTALVRCDATHLEGRFAHTLSGGELQRIRLARALAQEPDTLVLDEPTASLDLRHEMGILELLRASTREGMTVVLVTHHLNTAARFADRMILLSEGSVAAEGAPQEVLREDTLERVYRWPVAVRPDPITGAPAVTPLS